MKKVLKMQTRIYYMNVSIFEDEEKFRSAYALMPQYRKEKIDRMKLDKDKRLSLGAGYLLYRALKDLEIGDAEIAHGGKPCLLEHPDVHFNLSHSGEMAMCIMGGETCGCDMEKIREMDLKLSKRFFAASEDAYIRESEDPQDSFFRIWTLKESFMKATGEGFRRPLSSFEMVMRDNIHVKGAPEWFFHELAMNEGYRASCCMRSSDKPELLEIHFE